MHERQNSYACMEKVHSRLFQYSQLATGLGERWSCNFLRCAWRFRLRRMNIQTQIAMARSSAMVPSTTPTMTPSFDVLPCVSV